MLDLDWMSCGIGQKTYSNYFPSLIVCDTIWFVTRNKELKTSLMRNLLALSMNVATMSYKRSSVPFYENPFYLLII
jgi:hypothetical protein